MSMNNGIIDAGVSSEDKKTKFINKFVSISNFYGLTPFDSDFGFSIKRKINNSSNQTSLIGIFIFRDDLKKEGGVKILRFRATYGVDTDGGVAIRDPEKSKVNEPIDIRSDDSYCYNINSGKIFFKNKEITALELLNRIYNNHIKPTKKIKGLWIRSKLVFWRIIMKNFFHYISRVFYYCLFIVTGNKYSYEPFLEAETLNGVIIASAIDEKPRNEKEVLKQNEKADFLGFKADYWLIVFFSFLNFIIFLIFEYFNFRPEIIEKILKNNFLTLVYVISLLWFLGFVLPKILKKLIKLCSKLVVYALYKRLKV